MRSNFETHARDDHKGKTTSQIQDPTQLWQKNQETKVMRKVFHARRTEISFMKKKRKKPGRTRTRKCFLQGRNPKTTTCVIMWIKT